MNKKTGLPPQKIGIIAFAFGQQATDDAGPSNEMISHVALEVAEQERTRGNEPLLATQWETTLYCEQHQQSPDLQVSRWNDPTTHYIDTKGVLEKSLQYFTHQGVTQLVFVAHPFHLLFIRLFVALKIWPIGSMKLINRYNHLMSRIDYDTSPGNQQYWTRGPFVFVSYLVRAFFTGKHGE